MSIDSSGAKAGADRINKALNDIVGSASKAEKQARVTQDSINGVGSASSSASGKGKKFTTFLDGATVHGKGLAGILEQNAGLLGKVGSAANDSAGKVGMFTQAGRALMSLGLPGIIGGITVAFLAAGAAGISAAAQVEKFQANLLTMVKSTTLMKSAWAGLVSFANKTPFSLSQSVDGFTKLRALGLATSEAIMMSYGNTAAAMGKNMSQMIEAVADAVTGEFERLKEFGIKAKQEGDKVAFTFQGVTTTVGKNATAIQKYLVGIGATNFGGAMARQMDTLNGAFANLEDKFFLLMATLGDGMFGQTVKEMTNALAEGIGAVTPLVSGLMDIFGGLLNGIWEVGKGVAQLFTVQFGGAEGATTLLQKLAVAGSYIGTVFSITGKVVGSVLGYIGQTASFVVNLIQKGFAALFGWMMPSFGEAGQSAGQALVGILRAGEFIANQLPNVFAVALAEIKAMFSQTGAAIAKAMTGDFTGFDNIDLSFKRTRKVAGAVWDGAGKIYGDKKGNQKWIDQASGIGAAGNIDFAALGDGKKTADKGKSNSDAADKAKQQEEFWKGLEQELALSKLNTQEREKQAKVFEYQKLVGRDITTDEKSRLSTLLDQTKANTFIQTAQEEHRKAMLDLGVEQALHQSKLKGMTDEQLAVEKAGLEFKAGILKDNLVIDDATLATLMDRVRARAAETAELAKQGKMLDTAKSLAEKYSKTFNSDQLAKTQAFQNAALDYAVSTGQMSAKVRDEILQGIADAASKGADVMRDHWGQTISDLGDEIGGKWGTAFGKIGQAIQDMVAAANGDFSRGGVIGGIANLLGKTVGADGKITNNAFGSAVQGGASNFNDQLFGNSSKGIKSVFSDPLKSLSTSFGSFKDAFDPAKGGGFVKGIGSAVGGAMAGAQMGSQIAGVGKMLWGKFSTTGSQIGGALGSFGGPIGSAIGSLLGGTIGGLLKKTKYGTASIGQLAGGELGVSSLKGNSTSRKDNASGAAGSVISGLQSIAAELGATLTGSPSVSIGMYKKDWRVSDTGRTGKLKGKYSDVTDFGDDAEAAIAYAIQVALQDGILTGISEFSKMVISANGDEQALSLAKSYESILDALAKFNNPIKGAVDEAVKDIDTLTEQMKAAGASAADLANVEQYRSIKLKEILDDQLTGFNDTLKLLKGEGAGKSALALLNEDMGELDKFRQTLAKGGTVDTNEFNTLVQDILGQAGDIYGKQTSAYQGIVGDLTALTESAIGNVTGEFNKASGAEGTTAAVETQTAAIETQTQAINTSNQYLEIIANALTGSRQITQTLTGQNGVLLNAN
ncbi:hypothetical protein [Sphingobium sp. Ant17]|uniref:hypothetical protein n=1 Tax=Sphingobium sp. Ant17 TaxID=1461752 RepID=UPI00045142F8|nr:hypothetical protein [Sphingobium sp. Ant17]EXS68390.1 hypothetical protein BF95_08765 [Sphingobium sp. Ant17]